MTVFDDERQASQAMADMLAQAMTLVARSKPRHYAMSVPWPGHAHLKVEWNCFSQAQGFVSSLRRKQPAQNTDR